MFSRKLLFKILSVAVFVLGFSVYSISENVAFYDYKIVPTNVVSEDGSSDTYALWNIFDGNTISSLSLDSVETSLIAEFGELGAY